MHFLSLLITYQTCCEFSLKCFWTDNSISHAIFLGIWINKWGLGEIIGVVGGNFFVQQAVFLSEQLARAMGPFSGGRVKGFESYIDKI